ncbi:hypothetical protein ACQW02_16135 [Humitalea sp. 24SJ18S-53]|uniref:hypothetical protein n=1 Tax=Humitalea sp. 24SJ18S-53 TaxID=3422307 RepID=UPI003D66F753
MAATRRGALSALAAASAGIAPAVAAANPDAELIHACLQYRTAHDAYCAYSGQDNPEDERLWAECSKVIRVIDAAKPQTMTVILAKVRAANFDARAPDGSEAPENGPAADWAGSIMNDLLRLYGNQSCRAPDCARTSSQS